MSGLSTICLQETVDADCQIHGKTNFEPRAARRPRDQEKLRRTKSIAISLSPREQSLLYCELEYILTTALNDFITVQFNTGLLDAMKLKKVADGWAAKGRPKVVAFRYDLETQLDLVAAHVDEFRFFGLRQGNPVQITSLVDGMRANARAMRVRSFCHPDLVISRQVKDSRVLADLVGASAQMRAAVEQVWSFYERIVDRESRRTGDEREGGSLDLWKSNEE